VVPFIKRNSRAIGRVVMGCFWFITRKSRDYFSKPNHKKSLLGEAQKVITQKARFSLEKRGKTFIFRQPTL
jgi:hypothetical protein